MVATQVIGTTSAFFRARHYKISQGRVFDEAEDLGLPKVAVLGGRIGRTLFAEGNAVGKDVRLGSVRFEVIGVLVARGMTADGSDADNQVFVPVRAAMRRVFDTQSLSATFIGVERSSDLPGVERSVRELLRERHALNRQARPDDFTVQNQRRSLSAQQQIMRPLADFCLGLAVVSLAVGGAGILALMLLSVQERRWEIGLRVAVGATARDMFWQFLVEALLLGTVGGVAGVLLGSLGTWVTAALTHWALDVSTQAVTVSLATSVAVGLMFGALPARRAALLPPAQALGLE